MLIYGIYLFTDIWVYISRYIYPEIYAWKFFQLFRAFLDYWSINRQKRLRMLMLISVAKIYIMNHTREMLYIFYPHLLSGLLYCCKVVIKKFTSGRTHEQSQLHEEASLPGLYWRFCKLFGRGRWIDYQCLLENTSNPFTLEKVVTPGWIPLL